MAQLKKVLLLHLALLFLFSSLLICANSKESNQLSSRKMFGSEDSDEEEIVITKPKKKISSSENSLSSKKNQTKINPSTNLSPKNQTKVIKITNLSTKNQTKISAKKTNSTKTTTTLSDSNNIPKIELKKLNSTSKIKKLNSTSKPSNSTKLLNPSKKSLDLVKPNSAKNKTTTTTTKKAQVSLNDSKAKTNSQKEKQPTDKNDNSKPKKQTTSNPSWFDQDDDTDIMSEFTDLPSKFQQTLIPDLERISTTSKAYLNRANKDLTKNFKPFVGPKYAPTVASLVSFAFMLIPLLLVSLLFNRIKAYFSLQKLLIFVQVYLSIYFAILCLSSLVTGLEPLKFFYATSRSTYVCVQVLQTLAYVLYLLLLLMYLILVFSTDTGLSSKMLGLGQTFVGFAVGLHYYVAVFHRVVLRQPPKTNWKVHGIYATCFFLICLCARAERRKKAYLEDGGEEGKKN